MNGLLQVADVDSSRKAIRNLLQKYRDANGHVVHVVADTPAGAPIFTPSTPLADIIDELQPRSNEPVSASCKLLGKQKNLLAAEFGHSRVSYQDWTGLLKCMLIHTCLESSRLCINTMPALSRARRCKRFWLTWATQRISS